MHQKHPGGRPPLNETHPATVVEIEVLWDEGLSLTRIAKQVKIDRKTAAKYVKKYEERKKRERQNAHS